MAHVIRRIAVVLAVALLVVVVVAVLREARADRTSPPAASPMAQVAATATPAATVVTSPQATQTATASPTAAAADRYGYVFIMQANQPCTSGCRVVVRRERDGTIAFELDGVLPSVSPDGKRLAYWRTTPDLGPTDLRVLEVADPRTDRSVYRLTGQTLGSSMVWSNDGEGLLIVTRSPDYAPSPGPSHCFAETTVLMLDLATTPPATRSAVAPGSSACVYLPVAWDRPGRVAAAVTTGPGGYAVEYVTWNGNAATPFARGPVPRLVLAGSVRAATDAKFVAALEDNLTVLRVWPVADITKAEHLRQPARISLPLWRPGAHELLWTVGQRLEVLRYPGGSPTTLHTSSASFGLVAVRPDGSGVLIGESSVGSGAPPPPTVPSTRLIVIDLASRRTADVATIAAFGGSHAALDSGVVLR